MSGFSNKEHGFSLIELMITVAVLAILLTVAVPGFDNLIRGSRLQGATQELRTAITFAKTEAVRLRQVVSVCGSNADASGCNGGTNWGNGWLVTADLDGNGSDDVVRAWPLEQGVTVASSVSNFTFNTLGTPSASSQFDVAAGGEARCVRLLVSGQTFTEEGSCQ